MSRKKLKSAESNPSSNTDELGVSPPWIELPWDVTANILHRLGSVEILESAQKVCTTWWEVCQDPSMWRVIDMKNYGNLDDFPYSLEIMCRHAVDRSMGQLVEINIMFFGTDDLILYISQRAPKLRCLRLTFCPEISNRGLTRAAKGFPRLEELHLLSMSQIFSRRIASIGYSCPMLKSFTFDKCYGRHLDGDDYAFEISYAMPGLRSLQLFTQQYPMEALGYVACGCLHLESLWIGETDYSHCIKTFRCSFMEDYSLINSLTQLRMLGSRV